MGKSWKMQSQNHDLKTVSIKIVFRDVPEWPLGLLFVVVDPFSKMSMLAPYKKRVTTDATVKLFFKHAGFILGCQIPLFLIGTCS
jgi:hypothetical protein